MCAALPSARWIRSEAFMKGQAVFSQEGCRVLVIRERRGDHSLPGWLLNLRLSHPPSPIQWRLPIISTVWVRESNPLLGHLSFISDLKRQKDSLTFPLLQIKELSKTICRWASPSPLLSVFLHHRNACMRLLQHIFFFYSKFPAIGG